MTAKKENSKNKNIAYQEIVTSQKVQSDVSELRNELSDIKAMLKEVLRFHIQQNDQWMTVKQIAEFLNCSITTVHSRSLKGQLKLGGLTGKKGAYRSDVISFREEYFSI